MSALPLPSLAVLEPDLARQ